MEMQNFPPFAIAKSFTPMLNTKDWKNLFTTFPLPLEKATGLFRPLEGVAFPGTKFQILENNENIVKVKTQEYPNPVWIDSKYLNFFNEDIEERIIPFPSFHKVMDFLEKIAKKNIFYLWGGNVHLGIEENIILYPPPKDYVAEELEEKIRRFEGLDCSGLLYEATLGFTPRNTSTMLHSSFGKTLPIKDYSIPKLIERLRPLDILVWKGHMLVVFSDTQFIESRHGFGVVVTDAKARLEEILQSKKPNNLWEKEEDFLLIRWID